MLYLYDKAIVEDLQQSLNPQNVATPIVKVISADQIVGTIAQIKDDNVQFPIIAVTRDDNVNIDTSRTNFTRMHRGTEYVFDKETNNYYYERAIPVSLTYAFDILGTNTFDVDELVRELMFKYMEMYFLTIQLPYEGNRVIRFGITLDTGSTIEKQSSVAEYLQTGQLYRTILHFNTEGCMLVNYEPVKLTKNSAEVIVD